MDIRTLEEVAKFDRHTNYGIVVVAITWLSLRWNLESNTPIYRWSLIHTCTYALMYECKPSNQRNEIWLIVLIWCFRKWKWAFTPVILMTNYAPSARKPSHRSLVKLIKLYGRVEIAQNAFITPNFSCYYHKTDRYRVCFHQFLLTLYQ